MLFRSKALSFRSGKDYWIGLANRLVRPGKDCHRDAPEEYHQVLTGLQVALAPDADAAPRFAVVLPDGAQTAAGLSAVPQMLKLSGNAFTLPRLTDYKLVLLTAGHEPVLGLEVSPRRAVRGQSFKLTAHAVNPSAQAVRLDLVVDASPGLQAGQKLTLSCPPAGAASASCTVAVGPQTQPGYETLQLRAAARGGAAGGLRQADRFERDVGGEALVEQARAGRHAVRLFAGDPIADGRVIEGRNGLAGEWGHMPLPWPKPEEYPGPQCWCGRRGCLELWVCGPGLARDHGAGLTAEALAASGEDAAALAGHFSKVVFCGHVVHPAGVLAQVNAAAADGRRADRIIPAVR